MQESIPAKWTIWQKSSERDVKFFQFPGNLKLAACRASTKTAHQISDLLIKAGPSPINGQASALNFGDTDVQIQLV